MNGVCSRRPGLRSTGTDGARCWFDRGWLADWPARDQSRPTSLRYLDLKKNDMIGLRVCGRSRRPSEGSRRSRVWTSSIPTSALKARVSRTFSGLEPHSATPRSVLQKHQHGHGDPHGRPSPLLQARSQGRLVCRIRSTRRVELSDDNFVIPPALAARAAVLAFGDELLDLKPPDDLDSQWRRAFGPQAAR